MNDELTPLVLAAQAGNHPRKDVVDRILVLVFEHLRAIRRHDEDDISEFLVAFAPKVGPLIDRFQSKGVPFRHYLMRTVRWQWTSFQTEKHHQSALGGVLNEPDPLAYGTWDNVPGGGAEPAPKQLPSLHEPARRNRLILLALKSALALDDAQAEELCRLTGTDLAWMQSQLAQVRELLEAQRQKNLALTERQSEVYGLRLMAEARAQLEPEPGRREIWEERARWYRERLKGLRERKRSLTMVPTHLDLGRMLGIPKGTVDSGIFHLKKELASLYNAPRDDDSSGNQQPPQKRRARSSVARRRSSAPR